MPVFSPYTSLILGLACATQPEMVCRHQDRPEQPLHTDCSLRHVIECCRLEAEGRHDLRTKIAR
jgi:hypothetical protein